MDDPNITMDEYIRLEEVFNWETAKYGKIQIDEDVHNLRSVETKFPAITLINEISSENTLSCEPTNEFPAVVYNDALTSKSNFSTEPTLCPQHIDEFDLKDETSLSEYDEEEQNILYFNDLFPFNIIYPDDLKSDKDNDDNEIDMIQSSRGNENTQGSNNLLEGSHDKINKVFIMKSFVMELNVNIVACNYLVNGMLLNLIKNLYVPFGISFDPKRYYKDGVCTRMLRMPRDLRHQYLRFKGLQYTDADITDFKTRLAKIYMREGSDAKYAIGLSPVASLGGVRHLKRVGNKMRMGGGISGGQFLFRLQLQICKELDDTWAWVASRPERQPDAVVSAPEAAKDAPVADEGALAVPAPVQAPQSPPPAAGPARTMAQRLARVEEDVHGIRGALGEQREILDSMACDFSRFSTWTIVGLSQMMNLARVTYTSYADFQIPYARRTRR
ncbi:hypothetical protein Tco_0980593, partial [Tanacetum coccineum]